MKIKTLLASAAVSGLVLAQPAAAATRSYESLPSTGAQATAAAQRVSSIASEAEELAGILPIWLIVPLIGSVAAFNAFVVDGKSPG